jgi:hypothetical protein
MVKLHEEVTQAVRDADAYFEPSRWMEVGYSPHITHHGANKCAEGEELTVADFHLVELHAPNTCEVITRFALENYEAAA